MSLKDSTQYFDRELSWLKFNERVLAEAIDKRNPLLERVSFLQIFSSNLDEFFMKRVGGLKRQVLAKVSSSGLWGLTPQEQLSDIRDSVVPMLESYANTLEKEIRPLLKKEGIDLLGLADLTVDERAFVDDFFKKNVFPVLTPLAVDPGHPFPFISNLSISFGVLMRHPNREGEELFARVKVPPVFPAWLRVSPLADHAKIRMVSLYEVIGASLGSLFPGMIILDIMMFRVTRNADVEKDAEDAEDLLAMVAEELRERKFAPVVRLEHGLKANPKIVEILKEELQLQATDIYPLPLWLEFYNLKSITELNRPELKFPPWVPVLPPAFKDPETGIFDVIKNQDVLVHHPYESFGASVERFIRSASEDKKVIAIKMTLYRTGEDSPFIPFLIRAAESGKQVVCLVELTARFDEQSNIQVAQALEKAGVHVVYGIVGLKTHCKIALVIRQDTDGFRSYAHIGTGNYHSRTSKLYTDLGLFTANPAFTDDVVHLFHYLTGRSLEWTFRKLLVAPIDLRDSLIRMIEREVKHVNAGKEGHILVKLNNLQDPKIIQSLYDASAAGVKVDLIVRGVCCLRPKVKKQSDNIRVISILGRFLEHSRIFYFRNGNSNPIDGEFFIGSPDWMSRNLDERVEAVVPIEDLSCRQKLWEILETLLNDTRQAWELKPAGDYARVSKDSKDPGCHIQLMESALKTKKDGIQ